MAIVFDRIVIAVPDLPAAIAQYQLLLGVMPYYCNTTRGEPAAWLGLPNTVLELAQCDVDRPFIRGIVFGSPTLAEGEVPVPNSLQLDIAACDGRETADFRRRQPRSQSQELRVDHLVLRTDNAPACIDLFADELGVRLALDKTVPAWGGRMLFFRAGKLTLEVIEADRDPAQHSLFWGIAYQCRDLARLRGKLVGRGVALSEIRDGRKPDTSVATVKSHCLDIPTLLIEPAI